MSEEDFLKEFIDPECTPWTMDTYQPRVAILRKIRTELEHMHGTLLDVGCGRSPYRDVVLSPPGKVAKYVGMDLKSDQYTNQPDLEWDGVTIPLPPNSVDTALVTEVLEHCPEPERVLHEINRVLRPGGFLLATVPFLWPLHDVPHDEYRYTPFSLERLCLCTGFQEIELAAMGGWDAALATMLGLWVRRRPMGSLKQRILQRILMPFYRRLLRLDKPPTEFSQSCMITGLSVTARKPLS
jgi:SAM-dependent methyltransferase